MKDIYEKLLQTWIMAALQLHNLSKVKEKHWLHIPEITFEIKVVEKATELYIYIIQEDLRVKKQRRLKNMKHYKFLGKMVCLLL